MKWRVKELALSLYDPTLFNERFDTLVLRFDTLQLEHLEKMVEI